MSILFGLRLTAQRASKLGIAGLFVGRYWRWDFAHWGPRYCGNRSCVKMTSYNFVPLTYRSTHGPRHNEVWTIIEVLRFLSEETVEPSLCSKSLRGTAHIITGIDHQVMHMQFVAFLNDGLGLKWMKSWNHISSLALCKNVVSPTLTHWREHSLQLRHRWFAWCINQLEVNETFPQNILNNVPRLFRCKYHRSQENWPTNKNK